MNWVESPKWTVNPPTSSNTVRVLRSLTPISSWKHFFVWLEFSWELAASLATCIHMCGCPCVGDWVHMWLLCPQCHRIKIRDSGANTVWINQVFIQFNLKSILWIEFTWFETKLIRIAFNLKSGVNGETGNATACVICQLSGNYPRFLNSIKT